MNANTRLAIVAALTAGIWALATGDASAQGPGLPDINISLSETGDPGKVGAGIKILILMTVLSLAPSIIITMTSFVRIVVVMSFLRQALGTQNAPPNQVMAGLSLFMTFFIMQPVFMKMYNDAFVPFSQEKMSMEDAYNKGMTPLREFMVNQTREKDLALFVEMARIPRPQTVDEVPTHVVIPAFIISEMRTAFTIGFLIYIPFLVLDMVIASVLMSMGMMMLPPVMISLPFKLMLFVLVDGWYLIAGSLMKSFVM
ncbi:MAG: flagellar type III secretion system pore protein FliP [Nitrospinae bacterium]|nr:flagellar type III secretion system pore protein FliP [Nitrospinota bacterium]MBF0634783.1 flagellar type III secretion system pore protein FliP [Nitrospinota bacterium]